MTTPSSPPPASAPVDSADKVRGRLMQASLKALLDRVPGARDALPHLAALEGALLKRGASAVDAVPPVWLARIHAQLCSLPLPEDDLPLRDLHTRLQARLELARRPAAPRITLPPLERADPSMDMTRTVVIQEVSHSEFMSVAGLQRDGGADLSH